MELSRRRYLLAGGSAFTALAGCTGTDSPNGGDDDSGNTPGGGGSDPLYLEFGETAVFYDDDGLELQATPTDAWLAEASVFGADGHVRTYGPNSSDVLLLFVEFQVTNAGANETQAPEGLSWEADGGGRTVDRTSIRAPGGNYGYVNRVGAGETITGTAPFEVDPSTESGSVILEFSGIITSPPVYWSLDLTEVPVERYDLDGLSPGESVDLGTEEYSYSFTALGTETISSYTDYNGQTMTPADGNTFLLVEVQAENVGTEPVMLPLGLNMNVLADGSEIASSYYGDLDERYDADTVDPGVVVQGDVLFEVPETASTFTLQVPFGNYLVGTWELQ